MGMTKVKTGIIGAVVLAAAIPFAMQHRAKTELQKERDALRVQVGRIEQLTAENERLSNMLVRSAEVRPPDTNGQFRELLKLRGEVGRLRQENATPAKPTGPSALSGVTANPETFKAIRDQQKMAMTVVYKDFAKQAKLPDEQAEKLSDVHADYIMENVEQITTLLREGKTREEMNAVFGEREKALLGKVEALLGPEARAQYQEYTRNLASHLTEQFKEMLTGDKEIKDQQARQLFQLMQEEQQRALENAGLDPDFQTVPNMNFRNIASEEEAERNLKLLDGIYENVTARASSFLTAEEIQKFSQFRSNAINLNRMAVVLNRKMMAPGSK
jgi:type II secretory pathway pseudopilin PulG